jgi:hypothetical protein
MTGEQCNLNGAQQLRASETSALRVEDRHPPAQFLGGALRKLDLQC